jgi:hypothetical protein
LTTPLCKKEIYLEKIVQGWEKAWKYWETKFIVEEVREKGIKHGSAK